MRIDPNDPNADIRKEVQDNITATLLTAFTKATAYGEAIRYLGKEADAFDDTAVAGPSISAIALKWDRTVEQVVSYIRTLQADHLAYVTGIFPLAARVHDIAKIQERDPFYEAGVGLQMEMLQHMWAYIPDLVGPPYDWSPPPVDEPETPAP